MSKSRPKVTLRNLGAKAFRGDAPGPSVPPGPPSSGLPSPPVTPSTAVTGTQTPAVTSAETVREEFRSVKRRVGGPTEQGLGQPGPSVPWKPSLLLKAGRPLLTDDRLAGHPLVVATLGEACALPRDMEKHEELDDVMLLLKQMESALLIVQRCQISLSRVEQYKEKLTKAETDRNSFKAALEAKEELIKDQEENMRAVFADNEKAKAEIEAGKQKEADLQKRIVELKVQIAEENIHALRMEAWEMGWIAALKKAEIPNDHPFLWNPDVFPRPEPVPSFVPSTSETPAAEGIVAETVPVVDETQQVEGHATGAPVS